MDALLSRTFPLSFGAPPMLLAFFAEDGQAGKSTLLFHARFHPVLPLASRDSGPILPARDKARRENSLKNSAQACLLSSLVRQQHGRFVPPKTNTHTDR